MTKIHRSPDHVVPEQVRNPAARRSGDRKGWGIQDIGVAFVRLVTAIHRVCESCGERIPLPRRRARPSPRHRVIC